MSHIDNLPITQEILDEIDECFSQDERKVKHLLEEGVPNLSQLKTKDFISEDDNPQLLEDLKLIYHYSNVEVIECTSILEEYLYYIKYDNKFYEFHIIYGDKTYVSVEVSKAKPKNYIELKEI